MGLLEQARLTQLVAELGPLVFGLLRRLEDAVLAGVCYGVGYEVNLDVD